LAHRGKQAEMRRFSFSARKARSRRFGAGGETLARRVHRTLRESGASPRLPGMSPKQRSLSDEASPRNMASGLLVGSREVVMLRAKGILS